MAWSGALLGAGQRGGPEAKPAAPPPAATAVPQPALPQPALLVRSAVEAIDAQPSLLAKVRLQVDLLGQQMVGSGSYAQQGRGEQRKFRFELKVQSDGQSSSLQQVCDGKYVWMHQDLLGSATLSRIDLARVSQALARQRGTSTMPPAWISIGGLPKLLQTLSASFDFVEAQPTKLDQLDVWKLTGRWNAQRLRELLSDAKQPAPAAQANPPRLPKHLPDRAVLLLGRDDLFPYRIEYMRTAQDDPRQPAAAPRQRTMLVMELFEVQLDAPVDARTFTFQPGKLDLVDQTGSFLKSLGIADEAGADKRAARSGRSALK